MTRSSRLTIRWPPASRPATRGVRHPRRTARAGLVRLASLLIGDLDEAESIAQEAITRAFTGIAGYDPQTPFLAWIRGIVLNLARQHQRRLRRHAVVTDPSRLASAPGKQGQRQGVLSAILRDELASKLWLAVGQLPESYREAVVLHYVEGMDYSQISQITGVSAGACGSGHCAAVTCCGVNSVRWSTHG